jgi:hypothetical protein
MGGEEMTEFDKAYDDARLSLQYLAELYELRVQQARKLAEEWRDRWAGDAPAICLPLERQLPWEEK